VEVHVIKAEARASRRERNLAGPVIRQLEGHDDKIFAEAAAWSAPLARLGHPALEVHPDPVWIATEGALFGRSHAHGLLQGTVMLVGTD
jgi:hypothetical protein